jgi:hypothetical protein
MQVSERSQPVMSMKPEMPERRNHQPVSAFNIADGTVNTEIHRSHSPVDYLKFLISIDKAPRRQIYLSEFRRRTLRPNRFD